MNEIIKTPHESWIDCEPVPFHEPNSTRWKLERRNGVGASEISVILGFNKYQSAYELWLEKTGRMPLQNDDPSPQATWGHRMEPFLRDDTAESTGREIAQIVGMQSTKYPWLRCSPDGVFTDDGAIFEAKTTGVFQASEWSRGQVADHAELQVQTVMAVTGAPYAIVAVVIDRGELRLRRVERDDDELIPLIIEASREFWQHVIDDTEPPLDGSDSTRDALVASFPDHSADDVVDVDGAALAFVHEYQQGAELEKAGKAQKAAASNKLRHLIGSSSRIVNDEGKPLAQIKRGQLSAAKFAKENPELAEKLTITTTKLDTDRLALDHPELFTKYQTTSIYIPKGAA